MFFSTLWECQWIFMLSKYGISGPDPVSSLSGSSGCIRQSTRHSSWVKGSVFELKSKQYGVQVWQQALCSFCFIWHWCVHWGQDLFIAHLQSASLIALRIWPRNIVLHITVFHMIHLDKRWNCDPNKSNQISCFWRLNCVFILNYWVTALKGCCKKLFLPKQF